MSIGVRVGHEEGNIEVGKKCVMTTDLSGLSKFFSNIDQPILFFNVGTDLAIGDSYGPLIGTFLNEDSATEFSNVAIMGTIDDPVHATNLEDKLAFAKESYPNHIVIATDACLGRADNVGKITFVEGMLTPGAGVNKMLPPVGDYCLTAVVNVGGFMEYFIIQNTRLSVVYGLAKRTTDAIMVGLKKREQRFKSNATIVVAV